jgi:transposase-like protein
MERYFEKVDRRGPDDCWEWTAARFDKGYGAFRLGDKQLKAHRFGYEAQVGPIPEGQYVLHRCDNPPCQNPGHWFLGTHKDNAEDRETKGRGGRHYQGSFSEPKWAAGEVRAIRLAAQAGETHVSIAARYGSNQGTISAIVRRETWRHTDLDIPASHGRPSRVKVTREMVEVICREYVPGLVRREDLAARFGVSRRTISMILEGWRPAHLTG